MNCKYYILAGVALLISLSSHNCRNNGNLADQKETTIVKVSPATLAKFSKWNQDIVFLTSKRNPIKGLDEVNVSEGQAGHWLTSFTDITKLLEILGQEMKGLRGIGNVGGGTRLFLENPKLRLFVTTRDFEKHILETGGGIKILFENE